METNATPRAAMPLARSARCARRVDLGPMPPAAAGSRSGAPPRTAAPLAAAAPVAPGSARGWLGAGERLGQRQQLRERGRRTAARPGSTRSGTSSAGKSRRPTASRASSSSSSTGAPSSFFGSSSLSAGPAMNVVTRAISTSIANSASEITPSSSARFRTISSVRPRVFISVPMTVDGAPVEAGQPRRDRRAEELAEDREGDQHERHQPQLGPVEQADVGPAGPV